MPEVLDFRLFFLLCNSLRQRRVGCGIRAVLTEPQAGRRDGLCGVVLDGCIRSLHFNFCGQHAACLRIFCSELEDHVHIFCSELSWGFHIFCSELASSDLRVPLKKRRSNGPAIENGKQRAGSRFERSAAGAAVEPAFARTAVSPPRAHGMHDVLGLEPEAGCLCALLRG